MSSFLKPKPFIKFQKKEIYKVIFEKFNTKKNIVILNDKKFRDKISKKFKFYEIGQTKSMIQTIFKSKNLLQKYNKYFLLSCDCFGFFKSEKIEKYISTKSKTDLIIFTFKKSYLNKMLKGSHTNIKFYGNKVLKIDVKSQKISEYGHAGFFLILSYSLFKYLEIFFKSEFYKKKSNFREIIIDDYFNFLLTKDLCKINTILLDHYIHIGSEVEYKEYDYWSNYIKNDYS